MKTKSIFLLFVMAFMFAGSSYSQGYLLRKALNKKIDQKIDSAMDKSAQDKAKEKEQADKQNTDKNSAQGQNAGGTKETGRGLFGGKIDIKYDDEYKFSGRIYSQMEIYDKKDVTRVDYYTYYNSNTLDAGIDMIPVQTKDGENTVPTVFLYDNNNRCFMMLIGNTDSKTGIISTLPSDSTVAAMSDKHKGSGSEMPVITKTGNSKVIAGYKCDEYKIENTDNDGYSDVWMTKDVKIKADKRYWGKSGMPAYYNYPGFEGALMLAMESYDKKDKMLMKMETREIDNNYSHSISTKGITFMKMNFGQAGKK